MKDIYIVVASVINSSDLVCKHLAPWLLAHLDVAPDGDLPPAQDLRELWVALGAEPELVEVLAEELRLSWKDGRLLVASPCNDDGNLYGRVASALLALWRFKLSTASRWITVGVSCRSLVVALLTGFDSLVQHIRADPTASDFHIHGYARLGNTGKEFLAMAAIVPYVPDAYLTELIRDSRVPMQLEYLRECLLEEMAFWGALADTVLASVASVCGWSSQQLRGRVLRAGHVAIALITARTFWEAEKMPWSIATGDVDRNLDHLEASL
jgi:hypothetical protein